jgi:hypothetical protein
MSISIGNCRRLLENNWILQVYCRLLLLFSEQDNRQRQTRLCWLTSHPTKEKGFCWLTSSTLMFSPLPTEMCLCGCILALACHSLALTYMTWRFLRWRDRIKTVIAKLVGWIRTFWTKLCCRWFFEDSVASYWPRERTSTEFRQVYLFCFVLRFCYVSPARCVRVLPDWAVDTK